MKRSSRPSFQPRLEALEDRRTPSAAHSPLGNVLPPAIQALVASEQPGVLEARGAKEGAVRVVPFKVNGGGEAPQGLPLDPRLGPAKHTATGRASRLGKYTGEEGQFKLLSIDPATGTGTFQGSFVFVAANGDRLAFNYGADPCNPGTFSMAPAGDGKVVVTFVAEFTPDPSRSTGRFAKVTGGRFTMVARTEPLVPAPNAQGFTEPFAYTWEGKGFLVYGKGKK